MASEKEKDRSPDEINSDSPGKPRLSVEEEFERNFDALRQSAGSPLNGKPVSEVVISEFPDRPTPIMPERPASAKKLPPTDPGQDDSVDVDVDVDDSAVTVPAPVDYDALGLSQTASASPLPPPPDQLRRLSSVVPHFDSSNPPASVPSTPPAMDVMAHGTLAQIRAVMNGTHPSLNPSPLPREYGIPRSKDEDGPVVEIVAGDETEEDLLAGENIALDDPFALPPRHPSDPLTDLPSERAQAEQLSQEQINDQELKKLTDLVVQCSALFREKGIDLSVINSEALRFQWKNEPLDSMTTAKLIHAVLVEISNHLAAHLFEKRVNVPQTKLGMYAGKLIHRIAFVDYDESTVDCDPVTLQHFTMLRTLLAQYPVSDRVQVIVQAFIDNLDAKLLV